jgi:cell division transport system ATP-binding protein
MIVFKNVSKFYDGSLAVENLNFKIEPGEFVSLVGRSGSGKSTILKLIIKEIDPTEGEIFYKGKNYKDFKEKDIVRLRREIAIIFQDLRLLQNMTAYENVAFVMEAKGERDSVIKKEIPKIFELVGLENKINFFPDQLSGGEQQRVAIARALAQRPEVILADELTSNLDPITAQDILLILKKINELGTTIILATHNYEQIKKFNLRTLLLENGRILKDSFGKPLIIS